MKIGKFDVGIITFIPSIVTSVLLMRKSQYEPRDNQFGEVEFSSTTTHGRLCIVACHVVVIINYLVGIFLALTIGSHVYLSFAISCLGGLIIWSVIAIAGWKIITRTMTKEKPEANNNLEDLYLFSDPSSPM